MFGIRFKCKKNSSHWFIPDIIVGEFNVFPPLFDLKCEDCKKPFVFDSFGMQGDILNV